MATIVMQEVPVDVRERRRQEIDEQREDDALRAEFGLPPRDCRRWTGRGPLPLVDLAAEPQEPEWLVDDLLERETLALLGGPPGGGKTWLALSLALALVTRTPFLGRAVEVPNRVLYLDYENGARPLHRRLSRLGWSRDTCGDRLQVAGLDGKVTGEQTMRDLRKHVEVFDPDLVIIGTLASAADLDENDARSIEDFYARVYTPLRARGTSLLLLHHTRKRQLAESGVDRFRGSGHIVGRVDRAWVLDPAKGAFRLKDVKSRHHPAAPDVELALRDLAGGGLALQERTGRLPGRPVAPTTDSALGPTAPTRHADRKAEIQDLLAQGHRTASELAQLLSLSIEGVNKHLRMMAGDGLIVKTGRAYRLADPQLDNVQLPS